MDASTIAILLTIGLLAGMLSGMIGVGGGIVIVPALVFFLGFSQHEAQGSSLGLLMFPVGILAVMNYYKAGHIDFRVVGIMCLAFIAGGWLGSKVSLSLPADTIKKFFAVILFYTAFKMLGWDSAVINWIRAALK